MAENKPILVEIAPGELIDKITVLQIKCDRIADPQRLAHVEHELALLVHVRDAAITANRELETASSELKETNESLWQIEDDIRHCERQGDFGRTFVELARSVYRTNDRRARLKRVINEMLGSKLIEEKEYTQYGNGPSDP